MELSSCKIEKLLISFLQKSFSDILGNKTFLKKLLILLIYMSNFFIIFVTNAMFLKTFTESKLYRYYNFINTIY